MTSIPQPLPLTFLPGIRILPGNELEDSADAESEAAADVEGPGVAVAILQAHGRTNDVIEMDSSELISRSKVNPFCYVP